MNKNFLSILIASTLILSCGNKDKTTDAKHDSIAKKAATDTVNYTTIRWLDSVINFGTIKQGEKITVKFRCLNTGTKPLVLTDVRPGCGCTVTEYSKEAILPNKEGWVSGSFDSKHFCDEVHKYIAVVSNTSNKKEMALQFTGKIVGCQSNDKIVQPHPVSN